jgi:integrase
MAMGAIHRLSQKQITNLGDGFHADGGNLYFSRRTSAKGGVAQSWVFRYFSTTHHKTFSLGIGKYPEVSIEKARKRAFAYRVKITDGVDVAHEHMNRRRDIAAAAVVTPAGYTFERAAREFVDSQDAGWTPGSTVQWMQSLQDYVFPVIGNMAIDKVDTDHVLRVLKPIWKTKHETASRVRGRIERILDWAKAKKLRNGSENCARWEGHMEHLLAGNVRRVEHFEAVPVKGVAAFMRKVRACPRVSARALELLCLTATRTNEVRAATFGEFDLEAKVWVIPAARTKTGKRSGEDHVVPLSARAVEIVEQQRAAAKDPDGYVFVGGRTGGMMGVNQIKKAMLEVNGAGPVPHGLRSTFRDWCGLNGHPRDLAELSLSHAVGSKVERAYRRDALVEQRRKIMDDWASYCGGARG